MAFAIHLSFAAFKTAILTAGASSLWTKYAKQVDVRMFLPNNRMWRATAPLEQR
jgi:hypothetical protein